MNLDSQNGQYNLCLTSCKSMDEETSLAFTVYLQSNPYSYQDLQKFVINDTA